MLIYAFLITLAFCVSQFNSEVSVKQRLRNDLLKNYNKEERPVVDVNDTTEVEMIFTPKHVLRLEEKTEILSSEGYLFLKWTDQHLKWDPAKYNMTKKATLGDNEIWQPDLFILYSSGSYSIDQGHNTYVRVTNEGEITWTPPASFSVPCVTNFQYYPFDQHTCEFSFVSWSHDGDELHLIPAKTVSVDPATITGAAWKVASFNITTQLVYMGEKFPYNIVVITLTIQRAGSLYKYTAVLPVVFCAILTLAGFWLEIWSTSRYILGITNFVIVSLQLLNLSTALPVGGNVPILAQFSATAVCLSTAFLTLTVALDSLGRRQTPPNERLVRFLKTIPTSMLCSTSPVEESRTTSQQNEEGGGGGSVPSIKDDWLLVCLAMDRLTFVIFTVIYSIVTGYLLAY